MSPSKDRAFLLGSSPSRDIERLFDDQNVAETGWTPYIDKIFGTQPTAQTPGKTSLGKTPVAGVQMPGQGQPQGPSMASYRASPTQHRKFRHSTSKFVDETPFSSHMTPSPPWTSSFRTPLADKSFRVSDYLFDTPGTLSRADEMAYASIDPEMKSALDENDKENDPMVMGMLSTPDGCKTYRLFKTPMSAKLAKLNGAKTSQIQQALPQPRTQQSQPQMQQSQQQIQPLQSQIQPLQSQIQPLQPQIQQLQPQLQQIQPQLSLYSTPLKAQLRTPSRTRQAGIIDSSPSTILLTSTVKKCEGPKPEGVDNSPTPATKSHLSNPPCRLVHSNSAIEPAMGLFEGHGAPKTLHRAKTAISSSSSGLPMMATFSSSSGQRSGHKRRAPGSGNAGTGKFQIIFADMNSLKASYSNKRAKRARNGSSSGRKHSRNSSKSARKI
ncbi:hypothetical protein HII13_001507 [Brettanomyces bruxellensis]|uniref:DEBR0S3_15522g1_1 n=1 Tax=Dekkera bruxellensis TaxID=5007 RepID=A0A7D9H083_DEKBR|nr:hypothetical protein HII13_001507 [Brettanomyces bruxellensis]VUG18601.1 DEBR0S3_15522g1_1 [Brettanomyces bruxellensis]